MNLILQNIPEMETELRCTIATTPYAYELTFGKEVFSRDWSAGNSPITSIEYSLSRKVVDDVVSLTAYYTNELGVTKEYRTDKIPLYKFKDTLIALVKIDI